MTASLRPARAALLTLLALAAASSSTPADEAQCLGSRLEAAVDNALLEQESLSRRDVLLLQVGTRLDTNRTGKSELQQKGGKDDALASRGTHNSTRVTADTASQGVKAAAHQAAAAGGQSAGGGAELIAVGRSRWESSEKPSGIVLFLGAGVMASCLVAVFCYMNRRSGRQDQWGRPQATLATQPLKTTFEEKDFRPGTASSRNWSTLPPAGASVLGPRRAGCC